MAARNRSKMKQFKNGAARGDENNNSPCREGRPRLLKDKTRRLTTPRDLFLQFLITFCWCLIEPAKRNIGTVEGKDVQSRHSLLCDFKSLQNRPAIVRVVTHLQL